MKGENHAWRCNRLFDSVHRILLARGFRWMHVTQERGEGNEAKWGERQSTVTVNDFSIHVRLNADDRNIKRIKVNEGTIT